MQCLGRLYHNHFSAYKLLKPVACAAQQGCPNIGHLYIVHALKRTVAAFEWKMQDKVTSTDMLLARYRAQTASPRLDKIRILQWEHRPE
jgi:hypothetical protein